MATNLFAAIPAIGLLLSPRQEEVNAKNLDLPTFTLPQVAEHCHYHDCWIIINQCVYDVTKFLREHPGGEEVMVELAGGDATTAFSDKGHSPDARDMLRSYLVGFLATTKQKSTRTAD